MIRIHRDVDTGCLRRAFHLLGRRHEILRTSFPAIDGRAVQVISPDAEITLQVRDLRREPPSTREALASQWIDEEAGRPFQLSTGPLLRASLVRLGPSENILVVVAHHIISDLWSCAVLLRDISVLYGAARDGTQPLLPALPVQYADYSAWHASQMKGEEVERQLDYWKRQLDGFSPDLRLPTDFPRPPEPTGQGAAERAVYPAALSARLREFSRQRASTLFTTLVSSFFVLLHRYTGQCDIGVGTPVAGRSRAEIENLIGFFVNTVVLRARLRSDEPFTELASRLHQTVVGSLGNQDLPFERVVEELRPVRDPSRHTLFQVMFTLDNDPYDLYGRSGPGEVLEPAVRTAKFDLLLDVRDSSAGLAVRADYSTDLFRPATIVRLLTHYRVLLEEIAADPSRRIGDLRMLTGDEERQFHRWNRTAAPYPLDRCIHHLFEEQAERTPGAPAVTSLAGDLSFQELNRSANRLAHHLRAAGFGPGKLAGVSMERLPDFVVAILGILKAGGAYVPMDPSYPDARLRFIASDSGISVLIAQDGLSRGGLDDSLTQVRLPLAPEQESECEAGNPPSAAGPDDPAYVIYTSGSTGRPKGVVVPHRALVNHMCWMLEEFPLSPGDRVLQRSPASFDASIWEFFAPLLSGATLVIAPIAQPADPFSLAEAVREQRITILQVVPSLLRAVLDGPGLAGATHLRRVFCGGEPLPGALVRKLARQVNAEIVNLYGPTEACIDATFHRCRGDEQDGMVPIGRPIANVQVFVRNAQLQPVPAGVPGELWLGGAGLATGYLNLPELTAERFRELEGAACFRTGDLVRFQPDGTIEWLGRLDRQVKVRGHRIELEEIEDALRRHPDVKDAVVVDRDDAVGHKSLAAYVAGETGKLPTPASLREFLSRSLPGFMLPSWIVPLPALPLTPNGKVDRASLPAPGQVCSDRRSAEGEPPDEIEIRLARIWERVLGIRQVGRRDNFFESGGHSLLAVTLFSEIEKAFGTRLPLATLFDFPTVEGLAAALRRGPHRRAWSSLVPLQPEGDKPPFFCVHANGGNVLIYRDLAALLLPDQPFYGLQSAGLDGKEPMLTTVASMAERYLREIRTVQPEGPYFLGGFCIGAYVALEIASQLQREGQEVAFLASINTDGAWKTVRSFREGLRLHIGHLSRLPAAGKLSYLAERAGYRVFRTALSLTSGVWGFHRNPRRPLPTRLVLIRLFEINSRASADYRPAGFRGKLTYFQAQGDAYGDPMPFWLPLVTEGVEVHSVPGKHMSVFEKANAAALAETLKLCLARARERALQQDGDHP